MSNNEPKKLFFSLKGVDLDDDDALEAFTQQVWEQAMASWKTDDNGDNTGESHV